MKLIIRLGGLTLAGAVLAGCGNAGPGSAAAPGTTSPAASTSAALPTSTTPSASAAPQISASPSASRPASARPSGLPTLTRPASPPREPADNARDDGWITGMVIRGGAGPCYGLATDEGDRYALYSTAGIELAKGARVRVKVKPSLLRIYCGPGDLVEMSEAAPIR